MFFRHPRGKEIQSFMPRIYAALEIKKELEEKDGSKAMYDLAQSRT